MTKEDFDNYRFSINTRAKISGKWHKVTEVEFYDYYIGVDDGFYYEIKEVQKLKEAQL